MQLLLSKICIKPSYKLEDIFDKELHCKKSRLESRSVKEVKENEDNFKLTFETQVLFYIPVLDFALNVFYFFLRMALVYFCLFNLTAHQIKSNITIFLVLFYYLFF